MTDQTLGGAVSLKKIFLIALAAVVVITTLTLGVFAFMGWQFVKNQETEFFANEKARQYAAEVAQDLALVRAEPFFQNVVKAESLEAAALNAGAQLNRMLTWNIPEEPTGGPPAAGGLELPAEITDRLDDWGEEWAEHGKDFDPSTVDFGWMSELKQYQFWTLELDSPLGDALARNPEMDPVQFPSPEYRALTAWVKLRLLSALASNADPKPALDDVRHLAHLTLTTPNLIAQMVGIKFLSLMNVAAVKLDQPHLPLAVMTAARRSFWGQQGYLDFTIPGDLFLQIYPEGVIHPGACAAMDERLTFAAFTRETLEPSYPEEFHRFEARLDELQKGCRRSATRKNYDMKLMPLVLSGKFFETMTSVDPSGDPGAPKVGDGSEWKAVKQFGFLRKALGLILANLGKTSGLGPYEGEEPAVDES